MRLVIDTNVLLSALMSPVSPAARIFALWRIRKLEVLTAEQLGMLCSWEWLRARRARLGLQ